MKKIKLDNTFKLLQAWGLLMILDLFIVRNPGWVLEHFSTDRFLVNYISSSIALLGLLILIKAFLLSSRRKYIFAFVILLIPFAIQASYFEVYKKFVSSFGFRMFFEDPAMIFSLWTENLNILRLLTICGVIYLSLKILSSVNLRFPRVASAMSCFIITVVMVLMVFSWYSLPIFQNSVLAYAGSYLELAKMKTYKSVRLSRPDIPEIQSNKKLPNIIYVVGESLTLEHMSLYGYHRETTPGLERLDREKKIIPFNNAVSIGTKTRISVPYMLTGLEGIDPKGVIYQTPTIFNYAKAAGYKTAFITSQDFSWGGMKNLIVDEDIDYFLNGTEYNPDARVHKGADDLEVLEEEILPFMDNIDEPFFTCCSNGWQPLSIQYSL
jgi:glucan phosphoethanolaminetransferase (alkaline phosphatase superfamily)